MALWGGRFEGGPNAEMQVFSESLDTDMLMWREDIAGSLAHVTMLGEVGLLTEAEAEEIRQGLRKVEADIEAAEDAEDPTAAMVALILAHEKPSADPAAKLRAELEALKPSALRKRAKAAGASEDDIEDAGDAEEPKSAMIALILASAPEAAESER